MAPHGHNKSTSKILSWQDPLPTLLFNFKLLYPSDYLRHLHGQVETRPSIFPINFTKVIALHWLRFKLNYSCSSGKNRTYNQRINSASLYQLSYRGLNCKALRNAFRVYHHICRFERLYLCSEACYHYIRNMGLIIELIFVSGEGRIRTCDNRWDQCSTNWAITLIRELVGFEPTTSGWSGALPTELPLHVELPKFRWSREHFFIKSNYKRYLLIDTIYFFHLPLLSKNVYLLFTLLI